MFGADATMSRAMFIYSTVCLYMVHKTRHKVFHCIMLDFCMQRFRFFWVGVSAMRRPENTKLAFNLYSKD